MPFSLTTYSFQKLTVVCNKDRTVFSGPKSFAGVLGKAIQGNVWEHPVGPFDRIHCPDFPTVCDVTLREMNTDAQYLYKLCRAVIDGE